MKDITNISYNSYKELWKSIFGDTYRDKFTFSYHGLQLTGGGGNYPSYDLTLAQDVILTHDQPFCLSYANEYFNVPSDIMLMVSNKSTIARMGVNASCCTFIDNGFKGDLTLELSLYHPKVIKLKQGMPIVQVVAMQTLFPCDDYNGKYQNQQGRVGAR